MVAWTQEVTVDKTAIESSAKWWVEFVLHYQEVLGFEPIDLDDLNGRWANRRVFSCPDLYGGYCAWRLKTNGAVQTGRGFFRNLNTLNKVPLQGSLMKRYIGKTNGRPEYGYAFDTVPKVFEILKERVWLDKRLASVDLSQLEELCRGRPTYR
jgi:hypothetical protein